MSATTLAIVPAVDTPPTISFDGATTAIQSFATAYGPAVILVFGIALAVAASIWGFPKLLGLFKKTAK